MSIILSIVGVLMVGFGIKYLFTLRNFADAAPQNGPHIGRLALGATLLFVGIFAIVEGKYARLGLSRLANSIFEDPEVRRRRDRAEAGLARMSWEKFTSEEFGFEVLLPVAPTFSSRKRSAWIQHAFELNGGRMIDWTIKDDEVTFHKKPRDKRLDIFDGVYNFEVNAEGISFLVSCERFAEPPNDVDAVLMQLRNDLQLITSQMVLKDRAISLDGAPGRELACYVGGEPPVVFVRRFYIHDDIFYQVAAFVYETQLDTPTLERYFESFHWIPRTKPIPKPDGDAIETGETTPEDVAFRIGNDPERGIYRDPPPTDINRWHTINSSDDHFEIKFPLIPIFKTEGTKYHVSCNGDRLGFLLAIEREWDHGDAVKQFKWQIDRGVKSGNIVVNEIKYGSNPTIDADYQITAMLRTLRFRERIYDQGTKAYRLTVMIEGDADKSMDAERFFDSFKLLEADQQPGER